MSASFEIGMTHEITIKSLPEHSARIFFANLPDVFATPCLGGLMEQACAELIDKHLQPGEQSVGVAMDLKHLAATPLGMNIRVIAELAAVEGKKFIFKVEGFDDVEKIGEATHERFIIVAEKFNARVAEKAKKAVA